MAAIASNHASTDPTWMSGPFPRPVPPFFVGHHRQLLIEQRRGQVHLPEACVKLEAQPVWNSLFKVRGGFSPERLDQLPRLPRLRAGGLDDVTEGGIRRCGAFSEKINDLPACRTSPDENQLPGERGVWGQTGGVWGRGRVGSGACGVRPRGRVGSGACGVGGVWGRGRVGSDRGGVWGRGRVGSGACGVRPSFKLT